MNSIYKTFYMVIQCETFFTFIRHYFIFFPIKLSPGFPFSFTISQFINDHSFEFQNIHCPYIGDQDEEIVISFKMANKLINFKVYILHVYPMLV